ncbi:MAG: hypothetical protein GC189_07850 [Alphaproteobacteria bacterium]|nr:hypothetical protein [Alphaproteobacteria bacterium]
MWILRWPLVLILLVYVAACVFPAAVTTLEHVQIGNIDVARYSDRLSALGASATPLEAGLWYGAAVFLFIAMVRLMRRTQAFWAWLIGFALYGARWALWKQAEGGLTLDSQYPLADYAPIGVLLAVGLVILLVDGGDRAYWRRQDA